MEKQRNDPDMIDLLVCPGFSVRDRKILRVNDAAQRLFLSPGMEILPLLVSGQEEYRQFTGGCLWLQLELAGTRRGAVVAAMGELQVFLVDDDRELQELQVLALAAQELRTPLSNVMISADRVLPDPSDARSLEHRDRLSRGTAQLLRLVSNMSDALRYSQGWNPETRNLTAVLEEIFERSGALAQSAGRKLTYELPREDIYLLCDQEQLERAVYNLVSNALKFTEPEDSIRLSLKKQGKLLQLRVQDSGSGIADGILQNIFTRYLRVPSLEDSRFGLGLGMVLVRAAAANHGGTVLVDQPDSGTRVTMTLAIRENSETLLRSPRLRVDYAGERDHGLLELSESLPPELYRREF